MGCMKLYRAHQVVVRPRVSGAALGGDVRRQLDEEVEAAPPQGLEGGREEVPEGAARGRGGYGSGSGQGEARRSA